MASDKKYGFIMKKPSESLKRKPKLFDEDSDGDEGSSSKKVTKSKTYGKVNRTVALEIQKAVTEDPNVFEYDNLYEDFKAPAEKSKAADRPKSRYVENLLKAAEKRKKEQERRLEKKIQKEREDEGDEFKDKEAFVTSAYKEKLLELEKEKEEELREQQIEEMLDVRKQKDLSGFYRHIMKQKTSEDGRQSGSRGSSSRDKYATKSKDK